MFYLKNTMQESTKIRNFLTQKYPEISSNFIDQVLQEYETRISQKSLPEKVFYLAIFTPINFALIAIIFNLPQSKAKDILLHLEAIGCLKNIGSQWHGIKAVDIPQIIQQEPEETRATPLVKWQLAKGEWVRNHPQYAIKPKKKANKTKKHPSAA